MTLCALRVKIKHIYRKMMDLFRKENDGIRESDGELVDSTRQRAKN